MQLQEYLSAQAARHPSMQARDIAKHCYQAAFGAEHLLADLDAARQYFFAEYETAAPNGNLLYEPLSPAVGRVSLPAWKASGMPPEWLFRLFARAPSPSQNGEAALSSYLDDAQALVARGVFPDVPETEWHAFRAEYEASGMPAVRHSEAYRKRERPAYRVVSGLSVGFLSLLQRLSRLPERPGAHTIAIDGRAAAGKTTLGLLLETVLDGGIVHMDDFFIPTELRTKERLESPGGNVHYERFLQEVLPHLPDTTGFSYRRFDCGQMALADSRLVPKTKWHIVEGTYSCHPLLGHYADWRIFVDISPNEQLYRIQRRNGEAMARVFETQWIPLEEAYFQAFDIRASADTLLSNEI